jgi:hypothetical protein
MTGEALGHLPKSFDSIDNHAIGLGGLRFRRAEHSLRRPSFLVTELEQTTVKLRSGLVDVKF